MKLPTLSTELMHLKADSIASPTVAVKVAQPALSNRWLSKVIDSVRACVCATAGVPTFLITYYSSTHGRGCGRGRKLGRDSVFIAHWVSKQQRPTRTATEDRGSLWCVILVCSVVYDALQPTPTMFVHTAHVCKAKKLPRELPRELP